MSLVAADERALVQALRRGDEAAFEELVRMYHASLLRVARLYVSSRSVAEEVVQETWVGVLNGIGRFEGRSSLKTWIFRILTNTAKTRGIREGRSVPFSSLQDEELSGPTVDPERFFPPDHSVAPGAWATPPVPLPEQVLLADETLRVVGTAIEALPPAQRAVITLHDVEGWSADEIRNALELTETNRRVLLHRARAKVRRALEEYAAEAT
ncbi:MAG TPA: sigma-70 family RNA polymerase sigma factor [Gaiellaceae bacterium]|nr:sigma-70 family RNA polymerase sigma factor [Gaiellaceae bacterium]